MLFVIGKFHAMCLFFYLVANVQDHAPDPVTASEKKESYTNSIPPSRKDSLDSDVLGK